MSWSTARRSPARCSISDFIFPQRQGADRAGTGPYFYLPKLESHLEARLWNDVFVHAQKALGIANGTIKVTVLIETLPAAFEMDEILYELRDHMAGLNCGRWDYMFCFIKKLRASRLHPARPRPGGDGQGVPARLFAAADQDLPPPRRLRDGRHGGADPEPQGPGGQRGRLRQGARRQGARGRRRP